MQLTSFEIKEVTKIMKDNTELLFDHMKTKIENPTNIIELQKQFDFLEILEKSKQTINVLWDYISEGATILFVDGKLFSTKWYNFFGLVKLISVGKLFVDLIIEVYKIWAK